MVEPNMTEERLEPPTVTMVLKSKQATKSVKMSVDNFWIKADMKF